MRLVRPKDRAQHTASDLMQHPVWTERLRRGTTCRFVEGQPGHVCIPIIDQVRTSTFELRTSDNRERLRAIYNKWLRCRCQTDPMRRSAAKPSNFAACRGCGRC